MSYPRTVQEVLDYQKDQPLFLTNGCCENNLDDTDTLGPEVFKALKLRYQMQKFDDSPTQIAGQAEGFYPLTPQQADFIGEGFAEGPYGGANLAYAVLYKNKKYLAPTVEICFDGPDRPFSRQSYGRFVGALYPNRDIALEEAKRLAEYIRNETMPRGGDVVIEDVVIVEDLEIDRHGVCILVRPSDLFGVFQHQDSDRRHDLYKELVSHFFKGYRARRAPRPDRSQTPDQDLRHAWQAYHNN